MGEFNESDCSWKKIVLSKNNDKWVSTKKRADLDSGTAASTVDFSSEHGHGLVSNIKEEPDASNLNYASGFVTQNYEYSEPGQYEPDLLITELDPLDVDTRQPRGVGPRHETSEARALRLSRMSAYAAQRLANESPDQRASRLKRMSEYAARRLANESMEQRAKRLARMSEYAARRIANETPEQRKERLKKMSEYAARRQARKKRIMDSSKKIIIDGAGPSESSRHLNAKPLLMSSLALMARFDQFTRTDPHGNKTIAEPEEK